MQTSSYEIKKSWGRNIQHKEFLKSDFVKRVNVKCKTEFPLAYVTLVFLPT